MGRSGTAVVVLAAGKGVRMKSALPKVLHKVCGQTLIKRALLAAQGVKPERVVVVVGHGADLVQAEIDSVVASGALGETEVVTVLQDQQKGTGHAAQIGFTKLEGSSTVVIIPGDVPLLTAATMAATVERYASCGADLVFVTCTHPAPTGFGRVVRDRDGKPQAVVEEKDCTPEQRAIDEVNVSIYAGSKSFLTEALKGLDNKNAQGEYYLTDVVGYGVGKRAKVEAFLAPDHIELSGANSRAELSGLEAHCRSKINTRWMNEGVTLEDPAATYIDDQVTIGTDVYIGANTRIRGKTTIASDVVIEGNSLIADTIIEQGAKIKFSCTLDSARVGKGAQVGPFANLRPAADLGEEVRVGNFVEVKKSKLGKGAKANHLTYLGDAIVGAEVNVGAGTITCNYDGVNKHVTVIEDGAFIGSNTSLVAPVTVGAGAIIGAGSAITKNVSADALGLERSQQTSVEGWAKRRWAALRAAKAAKRSEKSGE